MTRNNGNNFSDAVKMFMNPEYITNFMKQIPTPDFSHATESAKRHTKAVTSANQIASESAQALMRRYAEAAQHQINESLKLLQDVTTASSPEEAVARHQEFVRDTVENNIANTKEIIDMASKSAMEMFNSVSSKISEDMHHAFGGCCSEAAPAKK